MIRLSLREIGVGAFVAAIGLASCGGGGSATGAGSTPTGVIPTTTPQPTPTPSSLPTNATPTPTPSTRPSTTPSPRGAEAFITFSGSFEFGPFTIEMFSNNVATVIQSTGQSNYVIPGAIANPFWHDLAQNLPVNDIQIGSCPKPTAAPLDTTRLTYQNQTSPDISCPGSVEKTKLLYADVLGIENFIGVRSMVRIHR
jgi:hypothetical protein